MKKIILIAVGFVSSQFIYAQNCLELSLTGTMSQVAAPQSSAEGNYGMCTIETGSNGSKDVKDAGLQTIQLQKRMEQGDKDFTSAMMQNASTSNMQQMMNQAKQQASQQNNINPQTMNQQQIMQQAMQQQMGKPMQDKPDNLKIVYKAYAANLQITKLNAEFSQKITPLKQKLSDDLAATEKIFPEVSAGCPGITKGEVTLPECGCVKGHLHAINAARITSYDNYTAQVVPLFQNYKTLINAQLAIIDDCVNKLHNGKDINMPTYKQMLFSSQSGGYGSIATMSGFSSGTITDSGQAYCGLLNVSVFKDCY